MYFSSHFCSPGYQDLCRKDVGDKNPPLAFNMFNRGYRNLDLNAHLEPLYVCLKTLSSTLSTPDIQLNSRKNESFGKDGTHSYRGK